MEIPSNKTLYVLVGVLGVIVVALLTALIMIKKPVPSDVQPKGENAKSSLEGKTLQELTSASEDSFSDNLTSEEKKKLQESTSASKAKQISNPDANSNIQEDSTKYQDTKPTEMVIEQGLQDKITAPNPK